MPKGFDPSKEVPLSETDDAETSVKSEAFVPAQIVSEATLVEFIEHRSRLLELALPVAVKSTNAHEWVDFGGSPWPSISACLKIMRRFGINMTNNHHWRDEREDEKGKYYIYYWQADFVLGRFDVYPEIGSTTSRDSFFAMRDGQLRPMSEIPEDSILKAARANCIVRGVTGILGLRNITWEDLNKLGIKRVGAPAVRFKKGGQSKDAQSDEKPQQRAASDIVPEEERNQVIKQFLDLVTEVQEKAEVDPDEMAKKYLSYSEGKTDKDGNTYCPIDRVPNFNRVRAISWLKSAIDRIKADYSEILEEEGADESGTE